jgi:hypothetical protein
MPYFRAEPRQLRLCSECFTYRHFSRIVYNEPLHYAQKAICEVCLESNHFGRIQPFVKEPCHNVYAYLFQCYNRLEALVRSWSKFPCVFRSDFVNGFDTDHPKLVEAYHKLSGPKPINDSWFFQLDWQMDLSEFVEEFVFSTGQAYQTYRNGRVTLGRCRFSNQDFTLDDPDLHPWPFLAVPWRGIVPDNVIWVTPDIWDMKMRHLFSNEHENYDTENVYPSRGLFYWKRLKKYLRMRSIAFWWEEKVLRRKYAPRSHIFYKSMFQSPMVELNFAL